MRKVKQVKHQLVIGKKVVFSSDKKIDAVFEHATKYRRKDKVIYKEV